MNIVAYCTSGLGNRLRPLASCAAASKSCGRNLLVYWDTVTENGCLAKFDELFENKLQTITLDEIEELEDCAIFSESGHYGHSAERESEKFGRHSLKKLGAKYELRPWNEFDCSCESKNVIINSNDFLSSIDTNLSFEFLRSLNPVKEIKEKIDKQTELLNLNKNIIGVHARGTDFAADHKINAKSYIETMIALQFRDGPQEFFLSTEDKLFEEEIKEAFGDKVRTYDKDFYGKIDSNEGWSSNFKITTDHVQDAVVEMYLLSKTNISIYHPSSTFAHISKILS